MTKAGAALSGRNATARPDPPLVEPAAPFDAMSGNSYYSGPASDHFDGTVFFNPDGQAPLGFRDLLRWQTDRSNRAAWPSAWPSPFPSAKPEPRIDRLRLTMVGHATLLIQAGGLNILTDPVWSDRASPYSFAGPRRVNAPGIAFADLPKIDAVLVSHNHYEHLDVATLSRLQAAHDPLVVTPLGNDAIIRRAVPAMRIACRDWHDIVEVGDATIHLAPVHHWSARGMFDRRMALWSGFVVETPAAKVFFAGDTGFDDGKPFKAVFERHGPMDLAILPIGAYEPRWFMKPQHQNPEEAVEAMFLLGAQVAAGCHWGTFRLTDEAIDEPPAKLAGALRIGGIEASRFRAMRPGEVWDIPQHDRTAMDAVAAGPGGGD